MQLNWCRIFEVCHSLHPLQKQRQEHCKLFTFIATFSEWHFIPLEIYLSFFQLELIVLIYSMHCYHPLPPFCHYFYELFEIYLTHFSTGQCVGVYNRCLTQQMVEHYNCITSKGLNCSITSGENTGRTVVKPAPMQDKGKHLSHGTEWEKWLVCCG